MKRLPIAKNETRSPEEGERNWFQTLEELEGDPAVEAARVREFTQDKPYEPPPGVDRRTFMTLMGASMALAGVAGCRRPEENVLPFSKMPEHFVPGKSEYYASAIPMYGTAIGLLVESVDGRPIKLEGNPDHPDALGGSTSFIQGSVLELYDPNRSKSPRNAGKEVQPDVAWKYLATLSKDVRARRGKGLAILTEDHRSPTTATAIAALVKDMPEAQVYRFEPFGRQNQRVGYNMALGEPRDVTYEVEQADVIVAFDADLFGTESNPVKNSRGFARRRRVERGNMNRIYVAEPCPTITGHTADHRLRIQARRIADLMKGLAASLTAAGAAIADGVTSGGAPQLSQAEQNWVDAAAKDLAKAKNRALVAVGSRQPAALHALAAAINHGLGSIGTTVKTSLMLDLTFEGQQAEGVGHIAQIVQNIKGGQIDTLVILGGNPVFNAPADLGFADALKKVKTSIHLSPYVDETSEICTWHLPRAHFLESWSDARSDSGVHAIIQPVIAPMYGGRTDAEILEVLVGGPRTPYEMVRGTWEAALGADGFDVAFKQAIHDGFHLTPQHQVEPVASHGLTPPLVAKELGALPPVQGDFEVVFAPDPHAYDGRFANNAWLMETPDPIHKSTWQTVGALSHTTAKKLGVANGDMVDVTVAGRTVSVPIAVTLGHADDSITLPVGLGRRFAGNVCKGVGVDTNAVRTVAGWGFAGGTVKKGAGHEKLAITQGHFVMEGRPLIRTQTVADHKASPSWAKDLVKPPHLMNLYKDWSYDGLKWGMAVDLTLCHGCMACVVACTAENNVPVVGAAGVIKNREMHWLRIDRYFAGKDGVAAAAEGKLDEAEAALMPMLCQHCENAPCEQVCPVNATSHSPEGINEMTYNRCIGTKYCGNNCPYKVRRFNYFNYNKDVTEEHKLVLNPDVTVRFRGVMEKCTFCVQRVNQAKIAAKKAKDNRKAREIIRGLQSACMQACPTEAITFGDLNDGGQYTLPNSGDTPRPTVAAQVASPRAYRMLEEINTRPRVNYLARITNPNPDLAVPLEKTPGRAAAAPQTGKAKETH